MCFCGTLWYWIAVFALYGLMWPYMALYGLMWLCMVLLLLFTAMAMCGLIRLSMDLCDLVWSWTVLNGPVLPFSNLVLCGILWSFMAEYRLFSRSYCRSKFIWSCYTRLRELFPDVEFTGVFSIHDVLHFDASYCCETNSRLREMTLEYDDVDHWHCLHPCSYVSGSESD